jgi:hypothetical protein
MKPNKQSGVALARRPACLDDSRENPTFGFWPDNRNAGQAPTMSNYATFAGRLQAFAALMATVDSHRPPQNRFFALSAGLLPGLTNRGRKPSLGSDRHIASPPNGANTMWSETSAHGETKMNRNRMALAVQ